MAALAVAPACARTLEAITTRGAVTLCAHANALPFSSRKQEQPGFQIELARALASALGVRLDVGWVVGPRQYRTVDCDMVLDTIVDQQVQQESRQRVSKPYHRSGVALAVPATASDIRSFADIGPGKRIGVQVGSLAQMVLGQRGIAITPFGFEDEMIEALAAGSIEGAAVSPATIGWFNLTHPARAVRLVHAYDQEPQLAWNVAVGLRGSDTALREKIDAAVERLLADGTVRAIYARYGVEHRAPVP